MLIFDYAQLAVMSGERNLRGAVTWRSIAKVRHQNPDVQFSFAIGSCFWNALGHGDQVLYGRHLPGAEVILRLVRWNDFQCAERTVVSRCDFHLGMTMDGEPCRPDPRIYRNSGDACSPCPARPSYIRGAEGS